MNTDLVFMYQGKISVLGFNITGGNEYRLGIYSLPPVMLKPKTDTLP
jgi:hypothetical protein